VPRIKWEEEGKTVFKTPGEVLENREIVLIKSILSLLERRQPASYPPREEEVLVWDIKNRKEKEISFFHTIIHVGTTPGKITTIMSKTILDRRILCVGGICLRISMYHSFLNL